MGCWKLVRTAVDGTAAGLIAPSFASAGAANYAESKSSMASGAYFTKVDPGRWAKKVSGHLPIRKVLKSECATVVKIVAAHEMIFYEHYIVKHVVLDSDFNFIAEHMFDPTKDKAPISGIFVGDCWGVNGDLIIQSHRRN